MFLNHVFGKCQSIMFARTSWLKGDLFMDLNHFNRIGQLVLIFILLGVCCAGVGCAGVGTAEQVITTYTPDETIFPNPEQGFYLYNNLHRLPRDFSSERADGQTLIWGRIVLEPYKNTPWLPQSFLDKIQKGFEIARDQGMKVIVRASYGHKGPGGDYTSYEDAPKQFIKNHMDQLSPIFNANADVIALFEAGFIGPWGEWHSTSIANDFDQCREILFYLLDRTPPDRMIVVRYPCLKQSIFALPGGGYEMVTESNAYSGQRVARVGHHNDCFLSSKNDVGTYDRCGSNRSEETAYLAAETLYTPFGGETCRPHSFNDCPRTIQELETLHGVFLNKGYHRNVLNKWKEQGCYDEIKKRLGARFELTESRIDAVSSPGGPFNITFTIKNVGFASLYNPRLVQIVFKRDSTETVTRLNLDIDPRTWKPGKSETVSQTLTLPNTLQEGSYTVYLNLPDPYESLQNDPRYSCRIANQNIWDSVTGFNKLVKGIKIQRVF